MAQPTRAPHRWIEERTLAELQGLISSGRRTAEALTTAYLDRIDAIDGRLRSIIEVNPDAVDIARARDAERSSAGSRGPLHGIPVVIKDNIDTADGMHTTAGSLALLDSRPAADATVVTRLREAGAVILGKANLSEWANFRGMASVSGWSARGGQTRNPYALDRSPLGSSSGSAVAVAANLAAVALGTETDGSIVMPAAANGVAGIKPTVGATSRAGVIPIAFSQDTVGPLARTVADAATVLDAIAGPDHRDPATAEAPHGGLHAAAVADDGLSGARIGIPRNLWTMRADLGALFDRTVEDLRNAGAEIIDPVDLDGVGQLRPLERTILLAEFKASMTDYLASRIGGTVRSLDDLIAFNRRCAESELRLFGQELFELAVAGPTVDDETYLEARSTARGLATGVIDEAMARHDLDALVAPTSTPAVLVDAVIGDPSSLSTCGVAAVAGYPLIAVPAGSFRGLPLGITFMGSAWSEPTLIRLAAGLEARRGPRPQPTFRPTISMGNH